MAADARTPDAAYKMKCGAGFHVWNDRPTIGRPCECGKETYANR